MHQTGPNLTPVAKKVVFELVLGQFWELGQNKTGLFPVSVGFFEPYNLLVALFTLKNWPGGTMGYIANDRPKRARRRQGLVTALQAGKGPEEAKGGLWVDSEKPTTALWGLCGTTTVRKWALIPPRNSNFGLLCEFFGLFRPTDPYLTLE